MGEWSIRPEVTHQFTRPMLERLMLRSWLRDGEVFAQIVSGTGNGLTPTAGVPFWLEALEADFVPQTSNESDKLNQGYIPITGADQRAIWFIKACRSLAGNWKRNGLMRKTCST